MFLRRLFSTGSMASRRLVNTQGEALKLIEPSDPYRLPMGHAKLALATFGSLYVGGKIAQFGVYLLDEYEIFVHSDDDDD